ncbi:TniB family NTP-binding protein [Pseudomonas sp. JQ170]|uniref:TniB family NTP-binding protein n=1 Tax=unclassified Pseudomonas TaxID=196821 RepID=UPI00264EA1FE|nr:MULTISPECIES: TniB family NTP-binding protein [unclassified Pseudomonas]MDN7144020.1 TniB family NTP-binding protein [Pseudomonas sp. JQ170]WRO74992.1 TniB family NTP-binding protein [Pseudomonas sp. 170C]
MSNADNQWLLDYSQQLVLFPSFLHAYTMLQKSVETARQRGIPTSAMVVGPSGCGKSTLLQLFRDSFGPPYELIAQNGITTIRPAFYCSVPSPVTVKAFAKKLVRELGCSDLRGDTVELSYRVMALLKTCQVEVCELDEFHHLARPEAEKTWGVVIDWLITMMNETMTPFVLAGAPECKFLLNQRPAFARRFPFVVDLQHLDFSEDRDSDYMVLLSRLDEQLYTRGQLSSGAHLTDSDVAVRLYVATSGNLEYIRMIIHGAAQHMLAHQRLSLEISDFAQASKLIDLKLSMSPEPLGLTLSSCYDMIQRRQ